MNSEDERGMTQYIVWKDYLNVGIDEIDEQHKKFAGILNDFYDNFHFSDLQRSMKTAFFTLKSYAGYHFNVEEDLMAHFGYPGLSGQKTEHDQFRNRLGDLKREFDLYGTEIKIDLLKFMKQWFIGHIGGIDKEVADYFRSVGATSQCKKEANMPDVCHIEIIPLIVWKDQYDFGFYEIDSLHRKLADAINLLYTTMEKAADPKLMEDVFREVDEFTDKHFSSEERIFMSSGYPDKESHIRNHKEFRLKFIQLKSRFKKFGTVIDSELLIVLKDWFINHTQNTDRQYLPFIK